MVSGLDVTTREVEELAIGRMVRFLHALDTRPDGGMLLGKELGEKVLLLRGADDKDGAGVSDCLGDILEERLVLLDPVAGPRLPGMKVANHMIVDHPLVRLFDIEMENARLLVIDPNDRVKMLSHGQPF